MDMVIDNNKLQIVQYSQGKFSPGVTKFIYSLPAFTQPDKTGEKHRILLTNLQIYDH